VEAGRSDEAAPPAGGQHLTARPAPLPAPSCAVQDPRRRAGREKAAMPATRRAAAPEGGPATLPPLPPPLPLPDLLRHWLIWLVALLRCLMPGAFVPMRPGGRSASHPCDGGCAFCALLRAAHRDFRALTHARAGAGSAPVVRLAGRELLRLPETLPREARALDASRNRVPALPRALPGWAALRSLNLGSNRLTHLPVRPDH